MWRERGRPPQRYVGVGFTTQGFDVSLPYIRQPGSRDPRASWIFEGIGGDEPIGGFGLVMGGVAGFELDRVDPALESLALLIREIVRSDDDDRDRSSLRPLA